MSNHRDALREALFGLINSQESEVLVTEGGRGELPGALKPRSIGMTSTHRVSSTQSYNLLIIETHSVEDESQVILSLGGIWKSSIWGNVMFESVDSACSPWDSGSTGLLDGDYTS